MRDYSEQALQVKKLASLLFRLKDIAVFLEMEVETLRDFVRDPEHEFYHAFHEGRLETKVKVNKSLIDLASNGSQPAINKVLEKQSLLDDESDEA